MRRGARAALLALCAGVGLAQADGPGPLDGDYIYHTRAGDTLIGLSRRLLREPGRWTDLQTMNRVERPRQIPVDTPLSIPYRWLRMTPELAQVLSVAGEAQAGGAPVRPGSRLAEGSALQTGATGSATLAMPDGSVVTVQRDSRLELVRLERIDGLGAHDVSFRLSAGRLETKVAPQRDAGRFEIRTPVAVTAVRGTQFRATYDTSDSDARTETLEGVVGVSASGTQVPVAAGFGTRVEQGHAPSPPRPLPPPPALTLPAARNSTPDVALEFAPVPGAVRYRVQLADEERFYAPLRDELIGAPPAQLADVADGEYWLRVRSVTAEGLEGPDEVRRFVERRAPPAPVLRSPLTGASVSVTDALLEWEPATAAASYEVDLARAQDFTGELTHPPASGTRAATATLAPGVYWWRVTGIDADGVRGAPGAPASFRVRAPAPTPSVRMAGRSAEVRWPAAGAAAYRVEIARDAAFRDVVQSALVQGGSFTSARLKGGDYYVRLRPRDDDGYEGAPGAAQPFSAPFPGWLKFVPLVLVLPFL